MRRFIFFISILFIGAVHLMHAQDKPFWKELPDGIWEIRGKQYAISKVRKKWPNGMLQSGFLKSNTIEVVGGVSYTLNVIGFYEDGSIGGGRFAKDTTLTIGGQAYAFKGGKLTRKKIMFHSNHGTFKQGGLERHHTVKVGAKTYTFKKNSYLYFHVNGAVHRGRPTKPLSMTLNSESYTFDVLGFDSQGTFIQGGLDQEDNVFLRFDTDGKLVDKGETFDEAWTGKPPLTEPKP